MKTNKKSILIGGLLAIVLVMAVGYAAFATSLSIKGTASVTSKWLVGFTGATPSCYNGYSKGAVTCSASSTPSATSSWGTALASGYYQSVTLTPTLTQPGDYVEYTLVVSNGGNLSAILASSFTFDGAALTPGTPKTSGNITVLVTNDCASYASTAFAASNTCNIKVKATYSGTASTANQSKAITGTITATQA